MPDERPTPAEQGPVDTWRSVPSMRVAANLDLAGLTAAAPQILELSDRDMNALLDAIAHPPAPNDAMRRAIARWREVGAPRVNAPPEQ